jgi:hypothetical protein
MSARSSLWSRGALPCLLAVCGGVGEKRERVTRRAKPEVHRGFFGSCHSDRSAAEGCNALRGVFVCRRRQSLTKLTIQPGLLLGT